MRRLAPILCAIPVLCGGFMVGAPPTSVGERLQQLLQRFPDADLDHDGKLTTDEFRQFKARTHPEASKPAVPTPSEKPAASGKLTITINSDKPVLINPRIYGINCAEMFIFDLVQKPEYLAALGELGLNTFLYPGGGMHHPEGTGGFNIRTEELEQTKHGTDHRVNKAGSPDFFQQFTDFVKPMHGRAVFIPNIASGTLDELDHYLNHMSDAGIPVESVVLGMEIQRGPFGFENGTDYVAKIKPFIEFLKARHPKVRIVGWSTPVGRRSNVPEAYRQWNKEVARVPGIDGFAQYGWTEFGSSALRKRSSGEAATPEQRLAENDAFVRNFPAKQIKPYTEDWGTDKKMFLLQWGTHADRNTVVEGLHSVDFLFFMTEYNATHDNYFEIATWSVPIMSDLSSGKRKGSGGGVTYQKDIALWSGYLYAKPLRGFYGGGQSLLSAVVSGVAKQGAMEVVKVLSSAGADGRKHLCILNRGPGIALSAITVDGKLLAPDASVHVESVSGDTLTTTGGSLKTFVGDKSLAALSIEPFSVTMLILP